MYSTVALIASIICFLMAFYVLTGNYKKKLNQYFFFYNLSLITWSSVDFVSPFLFQYHPEYAIYSARFSQIAGVFIIITMIKLMDHLIVEKRPVKFENFIKYFFYFFGILLIALSPTDLIIKDVDRNKVPIEIPGSFYWLFEAYLPLGFIFNSVRTYFGTKVSSGKQKKQLQYFLLALLVSILALPFVFLLTMISSNLNQIVFLIPYGIFVLYTFITSFAIVKHRLLDVEIVIGQFFSKTITFAIFFSIYILLYLSYNSVSVSSVYFKNQMTFLVMTGIFLWIAFGLFPTIQSKIQTIPDSVLLKDFFNIPETSKYFSEKMGKAIDLIDFFRTVEDVFLNIVGCSNVKVYLREDFQTGKSESVEKYFLVNQSDARMNSNSFLSSNNPLIQKGMLLAKAIVYDEEDSVLRSELEKLDSKIFIPCLVSQGEILGIVLLSGKSLNRPFTNNDLTFFDMMTTEFGIILDRILAYSNNLMLSLNLEKTQKSLMVSQFINEYIHEIKTPLTALEGFATVEDLSAKEINTIVLEQTSRIKNLLTNILKIANNQRIRDIKLVNINQIIESVLGLFTDMGKKVREFDSHLPYMYGDYEDLQIVFTNLIKNSREAMFAINRDKRQLTIQTKHLPTTNEIEISVTDTGPGIPEDKLQSIWKRFQTTKLNDGGSGLGLSIIKRIVAEHQGVVNVTSKVGGRGMHATSSSSEVTGTTFQIIFNLTENKKEYETGLAEKDWRIA